MIRRIALVALVVLGGSLQWSCSADPDTADLPSVLARGVVQSLPAMLGSLHP